MNAGRVARDQKRRKAAFSFASRRGPAHRQKVVGLVRHRDPDLAPVDDPAVARLGRRRDGRGSIAAGAGLGERKREAQPSLDRERNQLLTESLASVAHQRHAAEIDDLSIDNGGDACVLRKPFLHEDDAEPIRGKTSVLLRKRQRQQTCVGEDRKHVTAVRMGTITPADFIRREVPFHQAVDGIENPALLVRQIKIHCLELLATLAPPPQRPSRLDLWNGAS